MPKSVRIDNAKNNLKEVERPTICDPVHNSAQSEEQQRKGRKCSLLDYQLIFKKYELSTNHTLRLLTALGI